MKLSSLQFCGPANFDLPFWNGLESLLLTLPMICWLTRALSAAVDLPGHAGAARPWKKRSSWSTITSAAIRSWARMHNRFFVRTLAQRGELERLIAWYRR